MSWTKVLNIDLKRLNAMNADAPAIYVSFIKLEYEPDHDKTHKLTRTPSQIRVSVVHFMGSNGPKLSSDGQRRL